MLTAACRHGPGTSAAGTPDQRALPARSPAEAVVSPDLVDTTWRLVGIGGRALDPELPEITLGFESGRISGSGGCNWYTGWLAEADGGFTISHLAVTRRSCVHPRIMDREAQYVAALEKISSYRLTDRELTLMYGSTAENAFLVFEPSAGS